jgi:hypothetical protein
MTHSSAQLIAGSILMGAGAIAFAIGDLANATNMFHGAGRIVGVLASVFGLTLILIPVFRERNSE